uniref:Protein LTV1 homolog n=2 Tax=Rhizophora mucronata TaxID=61149 RepID=A0A2P2KAF2_RHIMU
MGKKKKKFVDKKKSATFQLMARDSSDPICDGTAGSDRVFVRVDNNPFSFADGNPASFDDDQNSIFADAADDIDGEDEVGHRLLSKFGGAKEASLPEHVRREILELGFPDDGYNYLVHLREIKNTGGGSAYIHNPRARLDLLPSDVKAYDASKVQVAKLKSDDTVDDSIYSVAARTVGIRVQKMVDPDVVELLDDDFSRFGSDAEDLEEDFVVCANLPEEGEDVNSNSNKKLQLNLIDEPKVVNDNDPIGEYTSSIHRENEVDPGSLGNLVDVAADAGVDSMDEKLQRRCLLDEQFDLLEHQEYGTDDEDDEYGGYIAEEDEFLADKLKHALNGHVMDDLDLDDKYEAPADLFHGNQKPKNKELLDSAADVLRRCAEYADKYENGDEVEDVVVQESSDESQEWDCDTIISTYSNLDNHPAKIESPDTARKKVAEFVSGAANASHMISLGGKEKLPVEFLPRARKSVTDRVKSASGLKPEQQKRKQHGQESREEKKDRKAAVKEEKREARRIKKEMRNLYRCEVQCAQRVAAVAGPSSIHLM